MNIAKFAVVALLIVTGTALAMLVCRPFDVEQYPYEYTLPTIPVGVYVPGTMCPCCAGVAHVMTTYDTSAFTVESILSNDTLWLDFSKKKGN